MKKSIYLILFLWLTGCLSAFAGIAVKTSSGKIYENAEVKTIGVNDVELLHKGVVVRVPLMQLSRQTRQSLQIKPTLKIAKGGFDIIVNSIKKSLSDFDKTYEIYLAELEEDSKNKGLLDQVLEIRKEKESFRKSAIPDNIKYGKLQKLRDIYDKERAKRRNGIVDDLKIALEQFHQDLSEIKKSLTIEGKLEDALAAKKHEDEVVALLADRKQALVTLGIFTSAGMNANASSGPTADQGDLSDLSQEQFEAWIQRQHFDFSGKIAGITKLKFTNGKVTYGPGVVYDYKVLSPRILEISRGEGLAGFTMEFSEDLKSATFRSIVGTYPVRINPPTDATGN